MRLLTQISGAARHARPARLVGLGERSPFSDLPSRPNVLPSRFPNPTKRPDRTLADKSAARTLSDIWTRKTSRVSSSSAASRGGRERSGAHKQTNCLLSEHSPSEPDEDYASHCLWVQERFVKAFSSWLSLPVLDST